MAGLWAALAPVISLILQALIPALIEAGKDTACEAKRDKSLEDRLRAKITRDFQ